MAELYFVAILDIYGSTFQRRSNTHLTRIITPITMLLIAGYISPIGRGSCQWLRSLRD